MHLHVQTIGHLIIHDVVPLHLRLFLRQFVQLHFQAVVLLLQEAELLLDAVACFDHGRFKPLPRLWRHLRRTALVRE